MSSGLVVSSANRSLLACFRLCLVADGKAVRVLGADAMLDLGHTAVVTANKQKRRKAHDHQEEAVEGSLAAQKINA